MQLAGNTLPLFDDSGFLFGLLSFHGLDETVAGEAKRMLRSAPGCKNYQSD